MLRKEWFSLCSIRYFIARANTYISADSVSASKYSPVIHSVVKRKTVIINKIKINNQDQHSFFAHLRNLQVSFQNQEVTYFTAECAQ